MLRLIMLLLLTLPPVVQTRHPGNRTPEPETQAAASEEFEAVQDRRCFIFVNRDGDVAERCP
jgi:hypothetical protein